MINYTSICELRKKLFTKRWFCDVLPNKGRVYFTLQVIRPSVGKLTQQNFFVRSIRIYVKKKPAVLTRVHN